MSKIKIENVLIGDDHPCFIIAEVGANLEDMNSFQHGLKLFFLLCIIISSLHNICSYYKYKKSCYNS